MKNSNKAKQIDKLLDGNIFVLGFGRVCVGYGAIGNMGLIKVSPLKGKQKLGSKVDSKDVVKKRSSLLIFSDIKSVDAMMRRLELVKKIMTKIKSKK